VAADCSRSAASWLADPPRAERSAAASSVRADSLRPRAAPAWSGGDELLFEGGELSRAGLGHRRRAARGGGQLGREGGFLRLELAQPDFKFPGGSDGLVAQRLHLRLRPGVAPGGFVLASGQCFEVRLTPGESDAGGGELLLERRDTTRGFFGRGGRTRGDGGNLPF
jgi:hypothetical protein